MLNRTHITLIILLAALVWWGTLAALGVPVSSAYLKPFAITVSVLTALCVLFDKWLWRWRIFKGWLVKRPVLNGTWEVQLHSSWVGPGMPEADPIHAIMVVRQTYSLMNVRLFTKESSSFLIAHKLVLQDDGVFQLAAVYQNTPDIHLRGTRSEIHFGALLLEVKGDPPKALDGHYWTDRGTKGSLKLKNWRKKLATNFEDGQGMYKWQ